MNFQPPDFTKDVPLSGRNSNLYQLRGNLSNKYQSPLLQQPFTKFDKSAPSNIQNNKFNSLSHNNYNNHNGAVHDRLGPPRNLNSYNRPNNPSNHMNTDRSDQQNNRNFNRKRPGDVHNDGPIPQRRKWRPNRPYYQKVDNPIQNSAQNRMNRLRNANNLPQEEEQTIQVDVKNVINSEPELNESQDLDATDITVEVINHNVQPREDSNLARFKMVLDSKTQAAIKVIQQKRKDKQVIFPFPVTPNVTEVSLHERFGML